MCVDAGSRIDEENHHVGFRDGLMRLARHLPENAVFGNRLESTSVDGNKGMTPHPALAVVAIARKTGKISHQGRTRTRDPVEQGGFADVRPSYERNDRRETSRAQFTPTKTRLPLPVCTSTPAGVAVNGDSTAPPPTLSRPNSRPSLRDRKCT